MHTAADAPLNIVVLVKHVPDAQFDRHLSGENYTVDRSESILSELDEYALETALQLVEATAGDASAHKVTALTMGPDGAVNAVKKALQIGAHHGVHLNDAALAGSDAAGTSLALAAAIRHIGGDEGVDLVITGMASTEGETSLVPAQLAERLDLPQVTFVSAVELKYDGDAPVLHARRDGATHADTIESALPALVSVTDQINEPRYPNFKGIMAAKKKPLDTLSLADVGVDESSVGTSGAWTAVESAEPRPPRGQGVVITDDGDAGVQLVDFLATQKLL